MIKLNRSCFRIANFKRKTRFVKLLLCFLLLTTGTSFAGISYAQVTKISANYSNKTIKEILDIIEQTSDFYFIYQDGSIDLSKKVSVNINSRTIDKILDELFASTQNTYRIDDKQIYVMVDSAKSYSQKSEQQEKRQISGVVKDASGEPLIGVTVSLKTDVKIGTMTDLDGRYIISVPEKSTLVFSYVGYVKLEEHVGSRSIIDVILKEDDKLLDEVVVVGYGVQKKSDLTGAISSVKAEELPQSATSSVENMLSGKVAGMQVTAVDAQPGGGIAIRIRGKGSVETSSDPLYVIDGFPISGVVDPDVGGQYKTGEVARSPLNSINPNDIESIEVLKDASATAIYGARAANGVVLITTKTGKKGTPKVNYDTKFSVQTMSNEWKLMTASELFETRNKYDRERWLMDKGYPPYGNNQISGEPKLTYTPEEIAGAGRGTDWIGEVSQTGITEEHNLSISGATDITNYLTSVNYYNQKGVLKQNDFTRYTVRLNLSQKIRSWLKVGVNATGSRIKFKNPTLGTGSTENSGLLEAARMFSPDLPVRDQNGNFSYVPNSAGFPNPVSLLDIDNRTSQDRILAQGYVELFPIKDLMLRAQFGIDKQNATTRLYLPKTTLYGQKLNGKGVINQGNKYDKLLSLTANYQKSFTDIHHFNFLIGYEWNIMDNDGQKMVATNFPSDGSLTNSMGDGKNRPSISSYRNSVEFGSYFGRVNYNLMDKYLFTFSLRADGSDKFGQDNRWGYFPSGAVAWRINQEKFIADINWISNAKLRLSIGQAGNSSFPGSAYSYYNFGGSRDYLFGGFVNAGAYQESFANSSLKWETTTEYNLGLDLGFINNRINVTFEAFSKKTKDLIGKRKIAYYLPGDDIYSNIGKSSSTGFDLNINTINTTGDFFWSSTLNVSAYKDKWVVRNSDVALKPYESQNDNMRVYWGYATDGILQPGEEYPYGNYKPGSQKVKDLSGPNGVPDGIINEYDRIKLANQDPDLIVGLTNTFEYKNFDLNIHVYGFLGWTKYNDWLGSAKNMNNKIEVGYNFSKIDLNNYWSSQNLNGSFPNIFNNSGEPGASQYCYEKADFIRVKNITFGYNFSSIPSIRRWFSQARLYVDVSNPFIFTKFTQIDPEFSGTYPSSRSVTFGLSLQF